MRLALSTWPEIEEYLKRSRGIIVPIGATEQHGPTGLIGTDALCAETLADGVGEACDALVAPTLSIGMSQHHLAFPGSMTLRPSTLQAVVRDVVLSLARHGFERVYFLNGHGGNSASVQAAFSEIDADSTLRADPPAGRTLRCKLRNWWTFEPVTQAAAELFGSAEGQHATCSELALTFLAHPEKERLDVLEPRVAPVGGFFDAADFRRRYPDGRIGSDPSLATVEAGKRVREVAVAALSRDYESFIGES